MFDAQGRFKDSHVDSFKPTWFGEDCKASVKITLGGGSGTSKKAIAAACSPGWDWLREQREASQGGGGGGGFGGGGKGGGKGTRAERLGVVSRH